MPHNHTMDALAIDEKKKKTETEMEDKTKTVALSKNVEANKFIAISPLVVFAYYCDYISFLHRNFYRRFNNCHTNCRHSLHS